MNQLSDVHIKWAASFLSIDPDVLARGRNDTKSELGVAAGAKSPAPMAPDCKTVRGKVPGPENHLLCATHGHIVDVTAKRIIAPSLEEYMKAHPAHHGDHGDHGNHGAHTSHARPTAKPPAEAAVPPAAAATVTAAATARAEAPPPIKIPEFTGNAKEVFAQECALLDTMRPSPENPGMYMAIVDGKQASIDTAQAEAILTKVTKQLEITITSIAEYNHSIIKLYESASARGLEHIGAGLNKIVSLVEGDGWIHDPGDDLNKLQRQWLAALSEARADLAQRHFQAAALKIADGEIKGVQAEHLFKAFTNKVLKNADTTVSVLREVASTSKTISKTIATATFGPAGAKAIDGVFAAAEVAGEALAGHEIDWAGRVIDLGMEVLMDKYGGRAEAAIKERVKGIVESKLKGIAKDKAKELAEKVAEKVAKKAVEKGSDFVKEELHAAAEAMKGAKKTTYDDLAKATVDAMRDTGGKTAGKLEAIIANDPDVTKLVTMRAA